MYTMLIVDASIVYDFFRIKKCELYKWLKNKSLRICFGNTP